MEYFLGAITVGLGLLAFVAVLDTLKGPPS